MNSLYIFLENLRDTMKESKDVYTLTEQEERMMLERFDNKWLFVKAVQDVCNYYKLTDEDKEFIKTNKCYTDDFAFMYFARTDGPLQMYYVLYFLELRYPILENNIIKIIDKMVL